VKKKREYEKDNTQRHTGRDQQSKTKFEKGRENGEMHMAVCPNP
jgi:hypothetical protein